MWHSMHFHFFQLKLFPVSTNQGEYQRVWHQHLIAVWLWGNDLIFLSLSFLYCKMWGAVPFSWGCFEEGERNYCVKVLSKGLAQTLFWTPCWCKTLLQLSYLQWQIQSHSTGCQASCPRHVINSLGRQFAFKDKQAEGMKTRQPIVGPALSQDSLALGSLSTRGAPPRDRVSAGPHKLQFVLKCCICREDMQGLPHSTCASLFQTKNCLKLPCSNFTMPLSPTLPSVNRICFLSLIFSPRG